jgi:hypothetical protein
MSAHVTLRAIGYVGSMYNPSILCIMLYYNLICKSGHLSLFLCAAIMS